MVRQRLGKTGFSVTPIGFGAFKIGRNTGIKYPSGYDLPDPDQVGRLLNAVLDLGINYIDTAPAYGLSEERIGSAVAHRRNEYVLSTKIGETFEGGRSTYDYSAKAVRASVVRSLQRLRTDALDIVLIHSNGDDLNILNQTDAVSTLHALRSEGYVRAIGMSGKTPEGTAAALSWADVVMVQYHLDDREHESVIQEATEKNVGVVVKKGLASGTLDPADAIRFVLGNPGVASLVVGGFNIEHLRDNAQVAEAVRGERD